ncbi:pyridoxamine 5'-phosphate oxidase [Rhodobacterales bacterium LSUCC0387]|nr:pyridoxamine 5'-phosphate oxidase [Rhodobacterales bacterium LSUCC0387]
MNSDPHSWAHDLSQLYAETWRRLIRGVHDRHAPARHPTLATVNKEGKPQARTVVLRAADRGSATLDIHTDLQSRKVADVTITPYAALHIWDPSADLQMRLEAEVNVLTGDDAEEIWEKVPEVSRLSYGISPPPGKPIPTALDYLKNADPASFAVLRLELSCIDALHLGQNHRRARFSRSDNWSGTWVAP